MTEKIITSFILFFIFQASYSCTISKSENIQHENHINWLSLKEIKSSLQDHKKLNIGFDVDDTLLFSSSGFYRGQQKYSPHSLKYLKNKTFWQHINNDWSWFAIPKESAAKLIQLHLNRGDNLYFITGRPKTKTEELTEVLKNDFNIPDNKMHEVIFTGTNKNAKQKYIKDLNILR